MHECMDHILKQKRDDKMFKLRNIVTDRPPSYEVKHLGVNISRGASTNLREYPETFVPDDLSNNSDEHVDLERTSCFNHFMNCLR